MNCNFFLEFGSFIHVGRNVIESHYYSCGQFTWISRFGVTHYQRVFSVGSTYVGEAEIGVVQTEIN